MDLESGVLLSSLHTGNNETILLNVSLKLSFIKTRISTKNQD